MPPVEGDACPLASRIDRTPVLQKPAVPPLSLGSLVSCPLRASRTLITKENVSRTGSEFGQAQTPVSHFFCGSTSPVPLPSLPHHTLQQQ